MVRWSRMHDSGIISMEMPLTEAKLAVSSILPERPYLIKSYQTPLVGNSFRSSNCQKIPTHSCVTYSKGADLMLKDPLTSEALEKFRQAGYHAIQMAIAYLTEQSERPVFEPMTQQERQAILQEPLSNDGKTAEELMSYVEHHIFSHPLKVG